MSAAAVEVVVYGTVCLDRFVLEAGNPAEFDVPGGEAFNTATQLAGWGVRVALTGTAIGDDPEGRQLRTLLDSSPIGLPRTHIPDDPETVTPFCEIRVARDGERAMRGRGFAQARAPRLADVLPLLAARPVFAACPNLGPAAEEATLAAADAGCAVISMDFAPESPVSRVATLWQNSADALIRQGRGQITDDEAADIVRHVVESGTARGAIFTQGERGGVAFDRNTGLFRFGAVTLPPGSIVDTTGAGDAFRAGLCYAQLQHLPVPEAIQFAAAAAALHCTRIGGGSRVPLAEVIALSGRAAERAGCPQAI